PPQRSRGRTVLGALRLPRRRPASPLAGAARARASRLRDRARRRLRPRLRGDVAALGPPPRREPRTGDRARRTGARPRLAPLSAGGAERLRERLHLDLPGPRPAGGGLRCLLRPRRWPAPHPGAEV